MEEEAKAEFKGAGRKDSRSRRCKWKEFGEVVRRKTSFRSELRLGKSTQDFKIKGTCMRHMGGGKIFSKGCIYKRQGQTGSLVAKISNSEGGRGEGKVG